MTIETTRRAILAGVPAAAIAATIPASAQSAPADRRAWEFALSRHRAIEQIAERFDAETFDPLWEKELAFERAHGIELFGGQCWTRKRDAFLREHGTAHRVPEEINDRHERLWEQVCDAAGEVLDTPAPDQAALRWKLDYLTTNGTSWDGWSDEAATQTFADIARLLPEGR